MASCRRIADYGYRFVAFFSIVLNPLTLRCIYYEDESVFADRVSRFILHLSDYTGENLSPGISLNIQSFGKISNVNYRR